MSRSINYTIHERRLRKPAPAPTSSSVARMACRNISRIRSGLLLLCTLLQRKDSLECAGINKEDADRQCHYRDIYYVVSGKVTCWRHCCRGCGLQQREMGVLACVGMATLCRSGCLSLCHKFCGHISGGGQHELASPC